ncbi:MAG TPA: hypothetical protein VNY36_06240 [Bacteroidia bacterium]|jgi:hypothetical protein|nr:hypothetical protein [Bacteroidia bacterium]
MREGAKKLEAEEFELKKLEFEKSIEQRNFEILNFWKRAWFFGALLLALTTGYFGLSGKISTQEYCIYFSFLALCVSLAQSLINRGSKYWQERWEYKTKHCESVLNIDVTKTEKFNRHEKDFIEASILAKDEGGFFRGTRVSVSKLTIGVWDIITIFWFLLWAKDFTPYLLIFFCKSACNSYQINTFTDTNICYVMIFHFAIFLYILFLIITGKATENRGYFAENRKEADEAMRGYITNNKGIIDKYVERLQSWKDKRNLSGKSE